MAVLNVKHGWNAYLAIAAAVAVGAAIGCIQGSLFSRFVVPSFVVTLAGLLTWQGALLQVLGKTGSLNITDPKITGLANIFYGEDGRLDHRRGGDRRLRRWCSAIGYRRRWPPASATATRCR